MARRWYHVDVDELEAGYKGGDFVSGLCERFDITAGQLDAIRLKFGIPNRPRPTRFSDAPSEDEERHSAASLALSPWVESRIAELREAKVLAEQKAEYEIAQVRMFRHHCSRI
jgi:hypothetical protein